MRQVDFCRLQINSCWWCQWFKIKQLNFLFNFQLWEYLMLIWSVLTTQYETSIVQAESVLQLFVGIFHIWTKGSFNPSFKLFPHQWGWVSHLNGQNIDLGQNKMSRVIIMDLIICLPPIIPFGDVNISTPYRNASLKCKKVCVTR